MVHEAMVNVNGQDFHGVEVEETVIGGKRTLEQVVEGRVMDDTIPEILDTAGDCRVTSEQGWKGMYNDNLYGEKHQYYHLDMDIMSCMERIHLECPGFAGDYFAKHRVPSQGVFIDMEMTNGVKMMEAFARVLTKYDHLEDINLVFYENKNLDLKTFTALCTAISSQKRLRRLSVNLRWCQQATDEWLEVLSKALPETLEHFELWVNGCFRLTNLGLGHMMENMTRCTSLVNIKLYSEGTGFTEEHAPRFNTFMTERKMRTMRMVGCGLDLNHFEEVH